MSNWKHYLTSVTHTLERGADGVKQSLQRRYGRDEILIFPYLTYGTPEKLFLKGRVLEDKHIYPSGADDSIWRNAKNAYKRFESDEVGDATVKVSFHQQEQFVTTDEEGFFESWLKLASALPAKTTGDSQTYTVDYELIAPLRERQQQTHYSGKVMVPAGDAEFGVISDVDDTVLQTGATSLISISKVVLFGNARTRLPFEGVAGFYNALQKEKNPIFYVSSSPWNLYDVLVEFFHLNNIPMGPLLLRDWGITANELLPTGHRAHKLTSITRILKTYPDMKFILMGDSGQEDPEIYIEIVRQYPERILGIYIRDVSHHAERKASIQILMAEANEHGVPLLLTDNTMQAAEHALAQGWVKADALADVLQAKQEDESSSLL